MVGYETGVYSPRPQQLVGAILRTIFNQHKLTVTCTSSRLMFSQDRHEIYVTFASWNKDYVDYLDKVRNMSLKR